MYLYDPMSNKLVEMNIYDISEIAGVHISAVSRAGSSGTMLQSAKCFIFKNKPSAKEKLSRYEKLVLEEEYWLNVKGSDESYKISNYGRFKRIIKDKEKFLLPYFRRGHMSVKIKFDCIYKEWRVDKLVAVHFLEDAGQPGEVLYHKNGIKTDDYANNLAWISREKLGKLTGAKANSKAVVLVDKETMEIIDEYKSSREAARKLPYSHQSILDYCHGKLENKYGDLFMFSECYEEFLTEHD